MSQRSKRQATTSPKNSKRKPKKPLDDSPARWKRIKEKYGITREAYNEILQEQGGACFLCQRTPEQIRRRQNLAVDHDHDTGAIRGLLCYNCNHRVLPAIRESVTYARRLVKYLSRKTSYGKVPEE